MYNISYCEYWKKEVDCLEIKCKWYNGEQCMREILSQKDLIEEKDNKN